MSYQVVRGASRLLKSGGLASRFGQEKVGLFALRCLVTSCDRRASGTSQFRPSEELAKERYELRANEDIEKKRSRLIYQSKKRGMLENGVILASFAEKYLKDFDETLLDQYDRLINLPTNDWDIFYWATKTKPTPPEYETDVMAKLRDHLKSKVSNYDFSNFEDVRKYIKEVVMADKRRFNPHNNPLFKNKKPGDVVLPSLNKKYELDPDVSQVDLTNYKKDLIDDRLKYVRGSYVNLMSTWRKRLIEKRIRRSLGKPISVRNMMDERDDRVYTEREPPKSITKSPIITKNIVDSAEERAMKHHNVLAHILKSKFTKDSLEYDDEALAWSRLMWHRNYGSLDIHLEPSSVRCRTCQSALQCCDYGEPGYIPREFFVDIERDTNENCQRCEFKANYGVNLNVQLEPDDYIRVIQDIKNKPRSVICLSVDLTDMPSGIFENIVNLVGTRHKYIVVGNKIDLLPSDGHNFIHRVTQCLGHSLSKLRPGEKNLYVQDVFVVSARTGFGMESLVARLMAMSKGYQDVYIVGNENSGKSTLFNALMQSDLCSIREGDLLSRISYLDWGQGRSLKMLKFPVDQPDEWQQLMLRRRAQVDQRNTLKLEKRLESAIRHRQSTMPHMSMLINRIDYPLIPKSPSHESHERTEPSDSSGPTSIRLSPGSRVTLPEATETNSADHLTGWFTKTFGDDHPLATYREGIPFEAKMLELDRNEETQTTANLDFEDSSGEDVGGNYIAEDEDDQDLSSSSKLRQSYCLMSPSVVGPDQLHGLLTLEERLLALPRERIIARKYTLRPLQSIMISGLARLDVLTANSTVIITLFVSKYLPTHVIQTRKADQFYKSFLGTPYLGVPFGDSQRMASWPGLSSSPEGGTNSDEIHIKANHLDESRVDVVLSSLGWALVTVERDEECILRAFTPGGRGIYRREPALLPFGRSLVRKKIRDTPLFKNPHYTTEQRSI